jgi:hypothetical protein
MSVLLVIGVFAAGLAAAVAKGILGKEIHGRIEQYIVRSVEATIASLPEALQAEYADEWLAELAATLAMPLSAAAFARGLRRSAALLVGGTQLTGAGAPRPRARPRRSWSLLALWHLVVRRWRAIRRLREVEMLVFMYGPVSGVGACLATIALPIALLTDGVVGDAVTLGMSTVGTALFVAGTFWPTARHRRGRP